MECSSTPLGRLLAGSAVREHDYTGGVRWDLYQYAEKQSCRNRIEHRVSLPV